MIKIAIRMSAAPRVIAKLEPLGLFAGNKIYILAHTSDEITKQGILEAGFRDTLRHYGTPALADSCVVNVFRGRGTGIAEAEFCRDEGIQILLADTLTFASTVAPDTNVLVLK
jgi:hypothetical protein